MKIGATSDTFGALPPIKHKFDVFIHCGNFCPIFDASEPLIIQIDRQLQWIDHDFNPWLKSIKAKHKIIIPGYLDMAAQYIGKDLQWHIEADTLIDEVITIKKHIFYGMSWVPIADNPYFSAESIGPHGVFLSRSKEHFQSACDRIPENTDILITRIPPYGILDEIKDIHAGSPILLDRINNLKNLKLHIFGLTTDEKEKTITKNNVTFNNAFGLDVMEISLDK